MGFSHLHCIRELVFAWRGGIKCWDCRKSDKSNRKSGPIILNLVWYSSFGPLVHMQKSFFLFMSTHFDMAAILFLEVVIFSDKEKSVFSSGEKNTSLHKKIIKQKKFYIIELHMEW